MQITIFQGLSIAFFALALVHIFFSDRFQKKAKETKNGWHPFFALFGNTTLIFGIWLVPTIIALYIFEGRNTVEELFLSINYREPFAYFVLLTIATIRPMIQLFHSVMAAINSRLGSGVAWCWALPLLLAALIGGVFSPIAIMALLCFYFSNSFFSLQPSRHLTYYTFATILVVSSASATIFPLNFNFFFQVMDPPLSHLEVFHLFGWKALLAAITLIAIGMALFKREFQHLQKAALTIQHKKEEITPRHLFYLLLFLLASFGSSNAYILLMAIAITVIIHKAFYREKGKEGELKLYLPLTIAFFTATLEIFARLQSFWAAPLLSDTEGMQTFVWTYLLTGLNEHIPLEASQISQNVSLIAVVAGGGLTLIAKSSNIVAKKILKHHFPSNVISPFRHVVYAVPLTLLFALIIYLLGRIF